MADPKAPNVMADTVGIQARNSITVAMEDLAEADRNELEKELEEEMAERRQRKLACLRRHATAS
jgi:hypothetical protein